MSQESITQQVKAEGDQAGEGTRSQAQIISRWPETNCSSTTGEVGEDQGGEEVEGFQSASTLSLRMGLLAKFTRPVSAIGILQQLPPKAVLSLQVFLRSRATSLLLARSHFQSRD